jgi:hypothetical protein
MDISKNSIQPEIISELNTLLDIKCLGKSAWIYAGEHSEIDTVVQRVLEKPNINLKRLINSKDYSEIYWTIRIATKEGSVAAGYIHYDNYKNTVLIPLRLPEIKPHGNLNIWENSRKDPKYIFLHLFQKLIIQNTLGMKIIDKFYRHKFTNIKVKPGEVAKFNGFQSLHYNDVPEGERRSLLLHFDRQFDQSILTNIVEKYSRWLAKSKLK